MLRRAFAAPEHAAPRPVTAPEVLRLVSLHSLEPRIGARVGWQKLRAELGDETATRLERSRLVAEANAQHLLAFARNLAERAGRLGIPVVFLKFAALALGGTVKPGERWASDIDLVVPEERADELWDALVDDGLSVVDGAPMEHQLPPLVHSSGGVVEVHRCLYGVRSGPGRPFMTVDDLQTAALLSPVTGMAGPSFVPVRELLLAHLLVHGIAQHGLAPTSYPMMRMVGDLIDLSFADADDQSAATVQGFIADDVSQVEVLAVRDLCRALAGDEDVLAAPVAGSAPAALVLRHILAGPEDPAYQRSLKVASLLGFPTGEARSAAVARAVFHTVFLSRAQVDAIYGPPRRRSGYIWRRVWRPFDLLVRLRRYSWSWLAMRLRRQTASKT